MQVLYCVMLMCAALKKCDDLTHLALFDVVEHTFRVHAAHNEDLGLVYRSQKSGTLGFILMA